MKTSLVSGACRSGNGDDHPTIRAEVMHPSLHFWIMLYRRSLLVVVLCCAGLFMSAQNTGTLRLIVDPGNDFSFVVDKKFRMQQREIKLTEGLHDFTIWAPTRRMKDTAVFVIANRTSDLVVRLPYSPEYSEYRHAFGDYMNKRTMRAASPVVLLAGLIWAGASVGPYNSAHDQLEADQANYDSNVDPGLINKLKDVEIPAHKKEFRTARNSLYGGVALTAIGAGVLWWVRSSTKGLERPVFEDKEKVKFEGLTWQRTPNGAVWAAGLSIPLAR